MHSKKLVQMAPVFIGIGLGYSLVRFHSIFRFPCCVKIRELAGPLVVTLILARIGTIGKLLLVLCRLVLITRSGIVLFSRIGGFLKSGGSFFDTLVWMVRDLNGVGYGIFITFIPLMITSILARLYNPNWITLQSVVLLGFNSGSSALAFANEIKEDNSAAALSYATVYPLVMFLRIMSPQLLAVLLWAA